MNCPICGSELVAACEQDGITPNPNKGKVFCMSCNKCNIYGSPKLWQKLSKTKQTLDRAIWWLNEIVESHRCTPISTAEMALAEIKRITKTKG